MDDLVGSALVQRLAPGDQPAVNSGLLGVQAEFYVIDFRNLKFKEMK